MTESDSLKSGLINGAAGPKLSNGTANGSISPEEATADVLPVTQIFANFVATVTPDVLRPTLREKLKEVIIDYIGVVVGAIDNADSTEPIYKTILALQGGSGSGNSTVLALGKTHTAPYAALLNATLGHSLDFDDTYAAGTLHAGVTAISAALTQAELLGTASSSDQFLLAVAVGYEVICRLGRELSYDAYSQGMHNTSTAGIFGAVAAIAVLKHLSAQTIEMAFGLAGSKAAGSMQYLENGSWNKRLHPGFAAHDAFICVALAENGVIGATKILEGKFGFLHAYSPNPNKDFQRLTSDLGREWAWLASSLKPYPACRMTHGFIEMAGTIHSTYNSPDSKSKLMAASIKSIVLTLSPSNYLLVGQPNPNKIHPLNVVDAQFSAYFQTACALLYGSNTGIAAYQKLSDPEITALCGKITVIIDKTVTNMGSRMKIGWADNTTTQEEMPFPLGEERNPYTRDKVDEKFLSLAGPIYGMEKAEKIREMVDAIGDGEGTGIGELMEVLADR